jgi:hypothetical protein
LTGILKWTESTGPVGQAECESIFRPTVNTFTQKRSTAIEGGKWKGKGNDVEEGSQKAIAALRHGVDLPGKLFGLHELRQRDHRIDLAKSEAIDGTNYYVLRITLTYGYTTTLYIDPTNWLITRRRDVRPLHVDVDPMPTTIESRFSDLRKIDGVLFAFVSTDGDLATGKILETTRVPRLS